MKITILYENDLDKGLLKPAWGFSALIEYKGRKILFDAGGDEKIFINNFESLGIVPEEIDFIFVSHKHWDHIAGLPYVLGPNQKVYFLESFPKSLKNTVLKKGAKLNEVSRFGEIMPGIYATGPLTGKVEEQSLIIDSKRGLIIITGCSHPGIVNIVKLAKDKLKKKIYLVVGGFHLYENNKDEIETIVDKLKSLNIAKIIPCHCTGKKAVKIFQQNFGQDCLKVADLSSKLLVS